MGRPLGTTDDEALAWTREPTDLSRLKDWAAGRLYVDTKGRPVDPHRSVLLNTEQVAAEHGSGHWTKRRSN